MVNRVSVAVFRFRRHAFSATARLRQRNIFSKGALAGSILRREGTRRGRRMQSRAGPVGGMFWRPRRQGGEFLLELESPLLADRRLPPAAPGRGRNAWLLRGQLCSHVIILAGFPRGVKRDGEQQVGCSFPLLITSIKRLRPARPVAEGHASRYFIHPSRRSPAAPPCAAYSPFFNGLLSIPTHS